MAFYNRNGERKRSTHDFRRQEEEVVRSLCRLGSRPISPRSMQEEEKRIRREIANSNERRRMQSINAGFQFLRNLLPQREGEKLSKASILQQTADYIYQLEQEKTCLLEQNSQLKRRVINSQNNQDSDGSCSDSPFPKRKKRDAGDSTHEKLGNLSPARHDGNEDMKREVSELKFILERERSLRIILEEQIRNLDSQLSVNDKTYNVALQDHVSYHSSPENLKSSKFVNITIDNDMGSPHSNLSDSSHEMTHRQFSPEYSHDEEVPEDLSGRNKSQLISSAQEASVSSMSTLPSMVLPQHASPPAFTVELEVTSQQETYKPSTSRQNLETIVEAIRHVEGDHMFRDDPLPSESPVTRWKDSEKTIKNEPFDEVPYQTTILTDQNISLQHQIIRNAPILQSRPGVIVSKLS